MKTRKLTLILTLLSTLSVSALNVLAQNKYVTTGTVVESGSTYAAVSNRAALQVTGSATLYSGTNLTLSSTFDSGVSRLGAHALNQGRMELFGSTITTTGSAGCGVYLTGTSVGILSNLTITTGSYNGWGVALTNAATGTLNHINITTYGGQGLGIRAEKNSQLTVRNVNIVTNGTSSTGIAAYESSFYGEDIIITTNGYKSRGLVFGNGASATINNLQITTHGDYGHGVTINGDDIDKPTEVHISNAQVLTDGYNAHGVTIGGHYSQILYMDNATVTTTGENSDGLFMGNSSTGAKVVELTKVTVNAQGSGISIDTSNITDTLPSYESQMGRASTYEVLLHESTISGSAHLMNISSIKSGTDAMGDIVLVDSSVALTVAAENSTLIGDTLTSGSANLGVDLDHSTLTGDINGINNSQITLTGSNGATVSGNVTGDHATAIALTLSGSDTTLTGTITGNSDSTLEVTVNDGSTITGDFTANNNSSLNLGISEDSTVIGSITGSGSSTLAVTVNDNGTLNGNLTTSEDNTTTVTISDGGIINGDLTSTGNSALGVTVSDSGTLAGDLTASGSSQLTLTGSDGATIIGNITGDGSSTLAVTVSDHSTLTGDVTANDNSSLNFGISEDGVVVGNITGSGSSTLDVTVSDSGTLTGNITTSEDNTATVSISDGGIITGDLNGSDNSTLAVTVGDNGTLTGALNGDQVTVTVDTGGNVTINKDSDFNSLANSGNVTVDTGSVIITNPITGNGTTTINDSGNVTVDTGSVIITNPITGNGTTTINDSGNLTASFDGGNGALVINPGGGVNLNQNSALGTISNDGTLNVGDYQVSVSDLTNNGTIDIAVNTDSGVHGTLHVTGTSSGAGTIHVTSTGDGQANPNDILGNLVTGSGVGNYTWDEVDWGLEELIVTPNPDGTISIKEDGTSPAGAVLNSAIATQQSLWFAQQNSLLKRMGDLRFNHRNIVSGKDNKEVTTVSDTLINNLWLRSYGQQLNIGSQVSGKAYEQLIYGVDLGTDHKFTLSADSDLYLGVYAGYGRSDLNYRTPGADGEINSYYGGLYATWLHASGFYLDATIKAASVDNNLKAPHGDTQLKANYSDVNLGGSIEIGKKFTFSDAWFIEPQFQVNYLHILAEDYTAGHMSLKAQDLDALQLRIGSLFGRTIKLTNGGALQPYLKVSGVETISSGGAIRNGYQSTRANTDGARAELGAGLIWQLDTNNQLHLDYEASFGDKYDKPWGLTAGYRHQF